MPSVWKPCCREKQGDHQASGAHVLAEQHGARPEDRAEGSYKSAGRLCLSSEEGVKIILERREGHNACEFITA